jgi:hypothetical protein
LELGSNGLEFRLELESSGFLETLDGGGVKWARIFGINRSGKCLIIWLELGSNGQELSWGQMGWNIWIKLDLNI